MSGNPFQLQGRVATVTGGGRGIGRGIVLALAQAGADIAIADIDLDSARKTAGEVEALGQRVCVVSVDVTDAISCRAGAETILEDLGGIHVLVNNAGVVQARSDAEVDAKDFERCYGVNLVGIWNMSSAVLPHFRQQGEGRLVNIASIAGRRGGMLTPYSASKAAAISLTQSQATALGPENINANAVCPGLVWTPMWEQLEGMCGDSEDPQVVDRRATFDSFLASACPLRREQTPEDVGHAVVFLASEAARNFTGQALNVDGGIQMN